MKTHIIILTVLFFMIFSYGFPQSTFRKTIDIGENDRGTCISQTTDGGYIVAGSTYTSPDNSDIVLVKTDAFGDTVWTKVYGGEYAEEIHCIRETLDNGFIIAATSNSFGGINGKAWIIKTDADGDTVWSKVIDGRINHILQSDDASYFLVGRDTTYSKASMIKLNPSGELLWSKSYGFSKWFYKAIPVSDDKILIGGLSRSSQTPHPTTIDLFMTNHSGDSLWFSQYGGTHIYSYLSLLNTFDGGYLICSNQTIFQEYSDMYLHKVDSSGNTDWVKIFENENTWEYAHSVVQINDSGYVITGDTQELGLALIKTNPDGDIEWEISYDTDSLRTSGYCLRNTTDSHLVVSGEALNIYTGKSDIILLKTDQEGMITKISEVKKEKEITIFPNPNRGDFHIQLLEGDQEVMIYDLSGRLIFDQRISRNATILKIDGLKSGSYVIHIKSEQYYRTARVLVL